MSIIDHARREMELAGFGKSDSATMLAIIRQFLDHWDSGGAVSVALPALVRLISGQPLTPLTGEPDEWLRHDYGGPPSWQNRRCSNVFKDTEDGQAYAVIDNQRINVTFPYDPATRMFEAPLMEVRTKEPAH